MNDDFETRFLSDACFREWVEGASDAHPDCPPEAICDCPRHEGEDCSRRNAAVVKPRQTSLFETAKNV